MAYIRFASIIPIVALLAASEAFSAQSAGPDGEVLATVSAALSAAQAGDVEKLRGQYAPNCVFIDEFAPFRWSGAHAIDDYFASAGRMYQETQHGAVKMTVSPPSYVYVSGDDAYVVEPLSEKATVKGKAYKSKGLLTFTLVRKDQVWKIASQTWSKTRETTNPY